MIDMDKEHIALVRASRFVSEIELNYHRWILNNYITIENVVEYYTMVAKAQAYCVYRISSAYGISFKPNNNFYIDMRKIK